MTDPDTPDPDGAATQAAKPQYSAEWAGREVTFHSSAAAHPGHMTPAARTTPTLPPAPFRRPGPPATPSSTDL